MHKLVQYFQGLFRNVDICEPKSVHIANFEVGLFSSCVEYCSISNVDSYQCSCKQCDRIYSKAIGDGLRNRYTCENNRVPQK